jgi:lipoprotein-anchoring transpeptidase ErfK/SrfK
VTRKRLAITVASAVAALVIIVGVVVVVSRGEEPAAVVAPETTTSTTSTTTAPKGDEYQVATATVPKIDVTVIPPAGVKPTPGYEVRPTTMQPIPRTSLNSAGVRATDLGMQYDNPTYFNNPLIFGVVSVQGDWVEVLLQARPNGQVGWVRKADVDLATYDAKLELDLSTRVLTATLDGEVIMETPATIGLDANPTPPGTYYIFEVIPQSWTGGAFGPFIMATSAYSEQLNLFEGGLPIVALHGTNEPDTIGEKASNGCIRIDNDLITVLAEKMPPGVPLIVTEGVAVPVAAPSTAALPQAA